MAWKRAAGLALAAAFAACSPPPPKKVVHDLTALLPVAEVRGSAPRAGRGSVFLPFGTAVDYYLDLPGESELSIAGLSARGAEAARLTVTVQLEDEAERLLERIEAGTGATRVGLPGEGRRLLRLGLRAEPGPRTGGVLISRPAVAAETGTPKPAPRRQVQTRPNILLYLVDTLRADRLGCYGYPRPVSPHLDRFARGATLFETAVAQAPWTRPSVASILTGLGPLAHGVRTVDDRLPAAAETLAERLRAAGYRTAAFSTNWHISAEAGFDQGFDDFLFFPQDPDSTSVNRRVLEWLDRNPRPRPAFLYVHTLDPHAPYEPPPDLRERFARGVRPEAGSLANLRRIYATRGKQRRLRRIAEVSPLYDAEVAANDRSFGALLEALRERDLLDGMLVVFVSDHGEQFGEHGSLGHARHLFAEELNVPLVVKLPFQARGARVSRLAQHLDLLPTLLAAAGLPPAAGLPGSDLFAPAGVFEPAAVSHLSFRGRIGASVVHGGWKWIEPWSAALGPGPALYRGKEESLSAGNPVRGGFLASLLRAEVLRGRRGLRPEHAGVDDETRRQLEALGYL